MRIVTGSHALSRRPSPLHSCRRHPRGLRMYDLWTTLATLALLVLSAWLGRFIRPRLPETCRTRETIETMQLVIGMLVTFAALVLSLLTASVKTPYDHAARARQASALRLVLLDTCLRDYG